LHAALKRAVERCEALLSDFLGVRAADVELLSRAELLGRDLLGAPAQAIRDVAAIEPDLAPVPVDAADDDVGVRVIGVVVIDCGPFELAPEVSFDARHQAPDVDGEIELVRVFG